MRSSLSCIFLILRVKTAPWVCSEVNTDGHRCNRIKRQIRVILQRRRRCSFARRVLHGFIQGKIWCYLKFVSGLSRLIKLCWAGLRYMGQESHLLVNFPFSTTTLTVKLLRKLCKFLVWLPKCSYKNLCFSEPSWNLYLPSSCFWVTTLPILACFSNAREKFGSRQ